MGAPGQAPSRASWPPKCANQRASVPPKTRSEGVEAVAQSKLAFVALEAGIGHAYYGEPPGRRMGPDRDVLGGRAAGRAAGQGQCIADHAGRRRTPNLRL